MARPHPPGRRQLVWVLGVGLLIPTVASAQQPVVSVVPESRCGGEQATLSLMAELARRLPGIEVALSDDQAAWQVRWRPAAGPPAACDLTLNGGATRLSLPSVDPSDDESLREAASQLVWLVDRLARDWRPADGAAEPVQPAAAGPMSDDAPIYGAAPTDVETTPDGGPEADEDEHRNGSVSADDATVQLASLRVTGATIRAEAEPVDEPDSSVVWLSSAGLGSEIADFLDVVAVLPSLELGLLRWRIIELVLSVGVTANGLSSPHTYEYVDQGGAFLLEDVPDMRLMTTSASLEVTAYRHGTISLVPRVGFGAARLWVDLAQRHLLPDPNETGGWLGVIEAGGAVAYQRGAFRGSLLGGYRVTTERELISRDYYDMTGPLVRLTLGWAR